MIDFMVLANARSATTWCANWLTTDKTICLHDPMFWPHECDYQTSRKLGVASTLWPMRAESVNSHPAKKLIVHRDAKARHASCEMAGLPFVNYDLSPIEGMHVQFEELFTRADEIYQHLLGLPFDEERHRMLLDMNVQPNFRTITIDKAAVKRLVESVR